MLFYTQGEVIANKKLETEFINLKKEFLELQAMIQNLLDTHVDLEKRYDKFIQKQRKNNFRYRHCGDKFESVRELKNHKEEGCSNSDFKCDECEKKF